MKVELITKKMKKRTLCSLLLENDEYSCYLEKMNSSLALDCRQVLKQEFERRCDFNSSYSLRAFARDLKMSPSSVSEILSGKKGLSKNKAISVSKHLGLSKEESEHLNDLIDFKHAKSRERKEELKIRMERRLNFFSSLLNKKKFESISNWKYFVILELFDQKPRACLTEIASKIGVNLQSLRNLIKNLIQSKMLVERDGGYFSSEEFSHISSDVPSQTIRNFHQSVLKKAAFSMESDATNEREISSTIFSFSSDRMEEAKADIKEFRIRFAKKYSQNLNNNDVNCLSMQFFSLLENKK